MGKLNKTRSKARSKAQRKHKLLPFATIESATDGDIDALYAILKHYEPYIATLATRRLYDECGASYLCVDEELRKRLEIKLIAGVLRFKPVQIA